MGVRVFEQAANFCRSSALLELLVGRGDVLVLQEVDEASAILIVHVAGSSEKGVAAPQSFDLLELVRRDAGLLLDFLRRGFVSGARAAIAWVARATRL